jgi:hypothetical protein
MNTETRKVDPGLEFVWSQHRIYSATAKKEKAIFERWRLLVFIFTVLAAFFAVTAHNITIPGVEWLSKVTGAVSALFAGLAAYAGSEILTDDREKNWIKARSASEAFKSQAYQYILRAGIYNTDDLKSAVFPKVEEMLKTSSEIKTITLTQEELKENLPPEDYSFDNYINERIKNQIYNYYFLKARKYDKISRTVKGMTLVLGFISVIIGTVGALGLTGQLSVWIAFISTFTGSAAAFVAAGHYNQIVLSYQATGNKLMMLVARWSMTEDTDENGRKDLVVQCESILNMENGAWMAEMFEKSSLKSGDHQETESKPEEAETEEENK